MVRSMTGFGRADVSGVGYRVTCEVKGVNHRFFDLLLRVSRRYAVLEDRIRERVKHYITRGRIEMSINLETTGEGERSLKVDKGLAIAYHKSLIELAKYLGIAPDFTVVDIFRMPEVFTLENEQDDIDVVWETVAIAVDEAMSGLVQMREKEGENLRRDILARSERIGTVIGSIEERSAMVPFEYAEKLRKRLGDMLSEATVDEARIAQEIAIFADRANITEEIVRLKSHLQQLAGLLTAGGAIGRKSDFLLQEMFREINTIGSKANDLTISQLVVEVKAELEKIREQLQNIE